MSGSFKLTPGRVFSGAAGNGPQRLALMGTAAVVILAAVGAFALIGHHETQTTHVPKMQAADPLPGGQHGTNYFHQLARDQARDQGLTAQAKGATYVPPLEGNIAPEPGPHPGMADPLSAVPKPRARPVPAVAMAAPHAADVANPFHPVPTDQGVRYASSPAQQPVKLDQNQVHAYDAAMRQLFDGMGGKGAETRTWVVTATNDASGAGGNGLPGTGADGLARLAGNPSSEPVVTPSLAAKRAPRILLPADRGIYGITKLASPARGVRRRTMLACGAAGWWWQPLG